ncbi:MAG: hypothetical protein M3O35_22395 [Acidobacteriota bacterium]|nr:hypothetical protein [Acidobacteriota bacterium]
MKSVLYCIVSVTLYAQPVPPLDALLRKVADAAARFPVTAVHYSARETLQQKAPAPIKTKHGIQVGGSPAQQVHLDQREIVSWYGLGAPPSAPQALTEYRKVLSVDGKRMAGASAEEFERELRAAGSRDKEKLRQDFEKQGLHGTATDFGQLLLLFTKTKQSEYAFSLGASERIGADQAQVIHFEQRTGEAALKIAEGRRRIKEPLQGELWIRESDGAPLRITLTALRRQGDHEVRDEARVEYDSLASGVILPAAVVHRRFVDDELAGEDLYRYSDWHRADKP